MKKSTIALSLAAFAAATASFAAVPDGERTIMTVGPEKVTLNEFNYLFNKNNQQQTTATPLDEYIDMFINYKLKVIAAKDAGYDTASTYLNEMTKYTRELARPYLRDKAVDDSLTTVAYNHMLGMVDIDHILIPNAGTSPEKQQTLADSVFTALKNGADFGELAIKYSLDKASARRGGHMGYIVGGMWPYTFEDLAFNTPVGELGGPAESMYGYHIVRVHDRKPNPGSIKTRHILKSTTDMDAEGEARQKHAIDSLLKVVRSGNDFASVARDNTDEPQGQKNGGDLPWFSTGQMVQEFNDAAFSLQPGEISDPVKTSFGWHIILCEDKKAVPVIDSVRSAINEQIMRDGRRNMAVKSTLRKWKQKNGLHVDNNSKAAVKAIFDRHGAFTTEAVNELKESDETAARLGNDIITVSQVASLLQPVPGASAAVGMKAYDVMLDNVLDETAMNQYLATLPGSYPDYRNLLNEYRDGMLLYEVSNSEVWNKANTDSLGLQRYYEKHRNDFRWDRPHYKGLIMAATSDSIAEAAKARLKASGLSADNPAAQKELRKEFGNNVKIERVLAGKGDNAVIDHLCFNAPAPTIKNRWKAYRLIDGKIIDQPENARDVKGQVSLAYQQQLEAEWLKNLRKRYKVKVDRKEIRRAFRQ